MPRKTIVRTLVVDDDDEIREQLARILESDETTGATLRVVESLSSFAHTLEALADRTTDLVILDLMEGADTEAGIRILERIRGVRFVPVIFYTALPEKVAEHASDLVKVVSKSDGPEALLEAIACLLKTGLVQVSQGLRDTVQEAQRAYLWQFAEGFWQQTGAIGGVALAYLLARQVSAAIGNDAVARIAEGLGENLPNADGESAHPAEFYLLSRNTEKLRAGDILRNGAGQHLLVLSPSCALGNAKADTRVLMAVCTRLTSLSQYVNWKRDPAKFKGSLVQLLMNKTPRYAFLPEAFHIPNLAIDFQDTLAIEFEAAKAWEWIARLDSPFCESLVSRFTSYYQTVGTPNLDTEAVLTSMWSR